MFQDVEGGEEFKTSKVCHIRIGRWRVPMTNVEETRAALGRVG